MTKTLTVAAAAAIVAAAVLTGCGGSDNASASGSYCNDMRAAKSSVVGLSENTITQAKFDELLAELHTLRDEAPASVKDDWTTFSAAADSFNSSLKSAGMTLDDVKNMQSGGQMESGPAMNAVMEAARTLSSVKTANAQAHISTEVRKDCKIDLDG